MTSDFLHEIAGPQIVRNILEEPRVTRFKIDWGGNPEPEVNEMDAEPEAVEEADNGNSLMDPPLRSFNIHTESSHSTMEGV